MTDKNWAIQKRGTLALAILCALWFSESAFAQTEQNANQDAASQPQTVPSPEAAAEPLMRQAYPSSLGFSLVTSTLPAALCLEYTHNFGRTGIELCGGGFEYPSQSGAWAFGATCNLTFIVAEGSLGHDNSIYSSLLALASLGFTGNNTINPVVTFGLPLGLGVGMEWNFVRHLSFVIEGLYTMDCLSMGFYPSGNFSMRYRF